jgi:DNA-binding SARP family transcriptional activator
MRYEILGPLEVRDGARVVSLARGRQRILLAVLLLHADEVVSSELLIDALWGESPPPTAAGSLHNLTAALRKALGDGALRTRGGGYELRVGDDALDARRFEALAAQGRDALAAGEPERAAALLRDGLALWRGPPLADLAYETALQAEAARLEELRLEALEERIEADLALSRHRELVPELNALVAEAPLRERLRAQQILALYRCGRQAEALAAYGEARRRLVDELGIEPGPALRRLEQAVLEQDPALGAPDALPRTPRVPPTRRRALALTAAGVLALLAAGVFVLTRRRGDRPSHQPDGGRDRGRRHPDEHRRRRRRRLGPQRRRPDDLARGPARQERPDRGDRGDADRPRGRRRRPVGGLGRHGLRRHRPVPPGRRRPARARARRPAGPAPPGRPGPARPGGGGTARSVGAQRQRRAGADRRVDRPADRGADSG